MTQTGPAKMQVLNIHGVGDVRLDPFQRPSTEPRDVAVRMNARGICEMTITTPRSAKVMVHFVKAEA